MTLAQAVRPAFPHSNRARGAWAMAGVPLLLWVISLAMHLPLMGDWTYEVDDQFYALVGARLTRGATLYIDIWDRKGPALYYTFALLAAIWPTSVVAYQVAAATCAALTAWLITRICIALNCRKGALFAGLSYLVLLYQFGGANAQTEVFFAPLLSFCAWCVVSRLDRIAAGHIDGRICLGFGAAGLALAFKQSAVFEGVGFGAACVIASTVGGTGWKKTARNAGLLMLCGAVPMLVVVVRYWWAGQFDALLHALVTSNVQRHYMGTGEWLGRIPLILMELSMPTGFAFLGWLVMRREGNRAGVFVILGWLGAAIVPILAYPNIFNYYLLTLLAPLCILGGGLYGRRPLGLFALAGLALSILPFSNALDWAERERSRHASAELVEYVRQNLGAGELFVAGQISYLYVLMDRAPPTAWPFSAHLFDATEDGATGTEQVAEVRRILTGRPSVVVRQMPIEGSPPNMRAVGLVDEYVRHCARSRQFTLFNQFGPHKHVVYSGCGVDSVS